MTKNKIYVGLRVGQRPNIFRSKETPTEQTHGEFYHAVIGPFRTLAGAQFMRQYGSGNPHCQTVADAEKLSKKFREADR